MVAPVSLAFRSIGFLLTGAPAGDSRFQFGLKPEDLTYHETSRLQVQQTLAGAWVDNFDRGIGSITLSGTTGWRGTAFQNGEVMFQGLRDTCFQGWHDGRADAIAQGVDPDTVQLFFTDSLDQISVLVAPRSFTLRRSKSSPLMMKYSIQLAVLDDADIPFITEDPIIDALNNPARWLLAVTGLQNAIAQIGRFVGLAQEAFGAAVAVVQTFVGIAVGLMDAVVGVALATVGVFTTLEASLLGAAVAICQTAANGFAAIADDVALLKVLVNPIDGMAAMFNDAVCAMKHAFDLIGVFPDYRAMRGASGCSSTGGGDPISIFTSQDVNPFGYVTPPAEPLVLITPPAQAAIDAMQGDPLLLRGRQDYVYSQFDAIGQGVSLP